MPLVLSCGREEKGGVQNEEDDPILCESRLHWKVGSKHAQDSLELGGTDVLRCTCNKRIYIAICNYQNQFGSYPDAL